MAKPSFLGSSNRWSSLAMLEDGDDLISKLPDEVLVNIVGRLDDIAEVARTGVLSTRWRQIPAMLPNIVMSVDSFKPKHHRRRELRHEYADRAKAAMIEAARATAAMVGATRANAVMIEAAKSMLGRSKTRSLYAIDVLRLEFYLGDDSVSIGRAVADAMAAHKVGLAEFTILTKKEIWQCSIRDLIDHGIQLRSFVGACPSAFGGLARLMLQNLRLRDDKFDGLPKILSTCKRLEFLRLYNCDAGHLSVLQVEHPRLSELEIVDCDFERVELKWLPELTLLTFSGWISPHDPVSFGHVPLLKNVSIANTCLTQHKVLSLSELLGEAAINELRLDFKSEKIWVKPEDPDKLRRVFHELRNVHLLNISEECDLTWTMFILLGAPSLKELCITVRDHLCEMFTDPEDRKKYSFSEEKKDEGLELDAQYTSGFRHHKLAVLRIYGFQSEEKFISYIWSVMDVAVGLEDVYLYDKKVCRRCHLVIRKPSKYPWKPRHKIALANKIKGMRSLVKVHFPPNSDDC